MIKIGRNHNFGFPFPWQGQDLAQLLASRAVNPVVVSWNRTPMALLDSPGRRSVCYIKSNTDDRAIYSRSGRLVCSFVDYHSGSCKFENMLGQHYLRRSTKVTVTIGICFPIMGYQSISKVCCAEWICELVAVIWPTNCWKRHYTTIDQSIKLLYTHIYIIARYSKSAFDLIYDRRWPI